MTMQWLIFTQSLTWFAYGLTGRKLAPFFYVMRRK
ncbi:hypothetical protein WRSd3_01920 [Shigella dysenteriae WRSd3]|uniref:Uncharacterized protein n=1 Tax=Shigella dysenteriae WRSd3 TaxID=1401327 RepID=A0A090NI57_SHIDY|nr:hypothetical protein WRSd3_01920 [Shigella dysenteriae WRSd3]